MKRTNFSAAAAVCAGLVLAASCSSWAPEQQVSDYERNELKGPVASMRLIPYLVDSVDGGYEAVRVEPSPNNVYLEFDRDGRTTLNRRFNSRGERLSDRVYEYDSKGRLISTTLTDTTGKVLESASYTYSKGRLVSVRTMDGDSLRQYSEYTYYDRDSVVMDFYFKENERSGYRVMTYDSLGNNITNVTRNDEGMLMSSFELGYDSLGRKDTITSFSVFFGEMNSGMDYNDEGFCIRSVMNGRAGVAVYDFRHKLDSHGNWIERESCPAGSSTPKRVERRELTYYEN
ncbi:MAG TPA: hypothetical protein IAC03_00955 [Candidatus Coprenecus pullistercoris]|nr:hypothetical protein [Candidatus Coprenecus pullistercoris]